MIFSDYNSYDLLWLQLLWFALITTLMICCSDYNSYDLITTLTICSDYNSYDLQWLKPLWFALIKTLMICSDYNS